MTAREAGKVTHYFDHIGVAVLALSEGIRLGDLLQFQGHSTDFQQEITSLQIEHKEVQAATRGDDVAIKVVQRVHEGDKVYKVPAPA